MQSNNDNFTFRWSKQITKSEAAECIIIAVMSPSYLWIRPLYVVRCVLDDHGRTPLETFTFSICASGVCNCHGLCSGCDLGWTMSFVDDQTQGYSALGL